MRPTRIVDDDDDGFDARLLRSALGDEPPRGAIRRAEAALGVGAGLGLTAALTATAKTASAHLAAAQTATQVGAASLAKWVGIGMVSGLVVTGGARYATDPVLREMVSHRSTATAGAPAQRRTGVLRVAPRVSIPKTTEAAPAEPAPEILPAVLPELISPTAAPSPQMGSRIADSPAPSVRHEAPRAATNVTSPASLASELSIIERARHALVAGQPDVVLRELEPYRSTQGAAVFRPEAEMLAIEALLQQGNVAAAQRRAARSLGGSTAGQYAARLREIAALKP